MFSARKWAKKKTPQINKSIEQPYLSVKSMRNRDFITTSNVCMCSMHVQLKLFLFLLLPLLLHTFLHIEFGLAIVVFNSVSLKLCTRWTHGTCSTPTASRYFEMVSDGNGNGGVVSFHEDIIKV